MTLQQIKNHIIVRLGGYTAAELEVRLQRAYRLAHSEGYAKAKARASGLLDGFYGRDAIGRPIDLSKLVRERV